MKRFVGWRIPSFVGVVGVFVCSCLFLARHYDELDACVRDEAKLRLACESLRTGSDLLSLHITRYVITGDPAERDAYFSEAQKVKQRDKAFHLLADVQGSGRVERHLRTAMTLSLELMQVEYHAMRLLSDEKDLAALPPEVRGCRLTDEEKCVTPAERQRRARMEILGDGYASYKQRIYHALEDALESVILYAENRTVHGWAGLVAFNVLAGASLLVIGWLLGSHVTAQRLRNCAP